MKWPGKKTDKKVLDAQEKLKIILKKGESLGLKKSQIIGLTSAKNLNFTSCIRFYLFLILTPTLLLMYNLDFHKAAYDVFLDWKHDTKNPNQCLINVPDTINRALRPPISCEMCRGIMRVERVSNIRVNDFEEKYAYSGTPVIVTDSTVNWTAPQKFSVEFFKNLYETKSNSLVTRQCQFFPYQTKFRHLGEFLNLSDSVVAHDSPWYVGWSNCDVEITEILRQHYERPYFLPTYAEGKRLDWIFMGSKGYGAPMHIDNVEFPSWQAQLRGIKKWKLQPPPECFYSCNSMEVEVQPGETIVLDTNQWYHSTEIVSDELSITIGAEFD